MKIKMICAALALTLAVTFLAACGKTEVPSETEAGTTLSFQDGQSSILNFAGTYQSDHRTMHVKASGTETVRVTVSRRDSAFSAMEWTMEGNVKAESDALVLHYNGGVREMITSKEDGTKRRVIESNACTGEVRFQADGTVVWTDDADERIQKLVFAKQA